MKTHCKIFPNKSSGLTLIEMMIVIAVIGIVAGFSIPYFARAEHKVKKISLELMGDMNKTKMAAIKENQDWRIAFDTANKRYTIWDSQGDANNDGDSFNDGDEVQKKVVDFSDYSLGVQYFDGSGGGTPVTYGVAGSRFLTFNPMGTCNSGYAYISYGEGSYRVGTLTTGVIRLHRYTGSAWE